MKTTTLLKAGFAALLLTPLCTSLSFAADQKNKMMDHGNMDHSMMKNMGKMKKTMPAKASDLAISGAWARMSFGRAVNSAGFMTIKNSGATDDLLIGVSAPVSKITELHTHIMDGQIMRMRRVEGGIPVPKDGKAELKPGGFHIMFIGLHKALKKGDTFPLTLTFKKAGKIKITVTVQKKATPAGMMDHSKMDHSKMDHSKMKMK